MNHTSRTIARLAGPPLMGLAVTEAMNMDIFAGQTAPVVYLNGALLLTAGVAIVQAHNRWTRGWPLLVTLTGWVLVAAGLYRMIAPRAAQATPGPATDVLFIALFALGAMLSFKGYAGRPKPGGSDAPS